jgi:hypothetical protein
MTSASRTAILAAATSVAAIALLSCPAPARAAQYIVDQSAPVAADDNPGTEDKPWKTVQHAADVAGPGDTVCVMEGNYPERVTLKRSGAEGKPVVFRSCPRRGAEVYGFATGKADWVRIEGFRVHAPKPDKPPGIEISSNHVEVLDNYLYGLGLGIHVVSTSAGNDKEPDSPSTDHIAYNEPALSQWGMDALTDGTEGSRFQRMSLARWILSFLRSQ